MPGAHSHVGELRGVGTFYGVELVNDRVNRTFFDAGESIGSTVYAAMLRRSRDPAGRAAWRYHRLRIPTLLDAPKADTIVGTTVKAVREMLGSG